MRIKRIERGYTVFLSDHEFSILNRIFSQFNIEEEWPKMTVGERRSWSRRARKGDYFRVDQDARIYQA